MAGIELKTGLFNGETGVPVAGVYETSATQKFPLGTEFKMADGSKFRYSKAGAVALTKALMTQSPAEVAHHKEVVIGTAAAIGATTIAIGATLSTATTADQYKDGYILINKGTGIGQMYRIKSNTAGTSPSLELYHPLVEAIDASTEITLKANPWNSVIALPTTATGVPTGIPLVDVTAAYYFWAQVSGPAPNIVDTGDTVVLGQPVGKPGTNAVAGACGVVANDGTDCVYGRCMTVGAAGEPALVFLTLE